jgi:hypothetical protein
MNQVEVKKAIFGFGLGVLVFYIGWRIFTEKPSKEAKQPEITKQNIETALLAYTSAIEAGETPSKLGEINDELAKEYGLRVKQRPADGRFVVLSLAGKEVHVA